MSNININWKTKFLIVGTLIGALTGAGAAYLLTQNAKKNTAGDEMPEISIGEALGIGISVIGIVRGIAALGDRKKK